MASTPGIHEPAAYLDRVFHRVAAPLEFQKRERVVVFLGADLHLQVEVVADLLADGLDDVEHETGAILQRSAVLVVPVVDRRAEELRDQVAVGAVQLDSVESCLPRAPCPFRKRIDRLADVVERHGPALEAVEWIRVVGGAESRARIFDPGTSR
jgi:hypothetical protein